MSETQVTSIEYSRTFRVAEYESEKIHVSADLEVPTDDLEESFKTLKGQVMKLHEDLKTLENPSTGLKTSQTQPDIIPGFDPEEFLDYPNWKRGKRLSGGNYAEGNCDYGWEFVQNKDKTKLNFTKANIDALKRGPIQIGDDYEIAITGEGSFVSIKKLSKAQKKARRNETKEEPKK